MRFPQEKKIKRIPICFFNIAPGFDELLEKYKNF